MRAGNNIITFKRPILFIILSKLAKLSIIRFNNFLFIPYKPNSLISYLTL